MDELKLSISKILDLEKLIFYLDNIDKKMINLNNNLNKISNKYIDDIKNIDIYLNVVNNTVKKVTNYKFDTNKNIMVCDKFKLTYMIISIFVLLIGICLGNILIIGMGIIMLFVCLILSLCSYLDRRYYFNNLGESYSHSIEEYLKLQKNLERLYAKDSKGNSLSDKYYNRFNLNRNYKLFSTKYSFFNDYYEVFKKVLKELKKDTLSKKKELYKDISVDNKYQNYLAMSVFYEYLKKYNFDTLDDIYNLYNKEYGFIINEDKNSISKFCDNKLAMDYDNSNLLSFETILNKIGLCITESKNDLDYLIILVINLNAEFEKVIKLTNFFNNRIDSLDDYLNSSGIADYYLEKLKNKYLEELSLKMENLKI